MSVDIATPDGTADAYLARPGGSGPFPAVLFYMDAFGLRPHLSSRPRLFEQIVPMLQAVTPEAAMRDAEACLRWLAGSPLTTDGPVGITGYCMGAGLALRTAGTYPDRVAAAAGFHGADLASTAPDSPHLLAGHITAELYFGHADQDHALPPEQIDRLEEALTDAGVRHRCEVYTGARHGFTQADTSAYDADAAERHWEALLDLFERTLSAATRFTAD